MIHLDSCYLIRALAPGSAEDRRLRDFLRHGEELAASTVAWAEFLCGPVAPHQLALAARVVTRRLPLVEGDAVLAAELFNRTGRRRGTLNDCLIAAAAIRADAPLATGNPADFARFEGAGLVLVASQA